MNKQQTKFILTIGLNDKDTLTQKYDTITAYKMIENVLKQYTTGYTMYEANGGYIMQNTNEFISEKSIRVELPFTEWDTIKKIVETIKSPEILNQETIAVETIVNNQQYL